MHPVIEIKECAPVESMESLAALLLAREEKEMFTIITFGKAQAVRIKQLMPDDKGFYFFPGSHDRLMGTENMVDFLIPVLFDGSDQALHIIPPYAYRQRSRKPHPCARIPVVSC